MSAQNDPPLTRREARRLQELAEQQANEAASPSPSPSPEAEPSPVAASVGSAPGSLHSAPAVPSAPVAPWASAPGSYRRRDFAPPSSPAAASAPAAPTFANFGRPEPQDEPLAYRTQGREVPASVPELVEPAERPALIEPGPVPAEPAAADDDRPLSRRELRALLRAEQGDDSGEAADEAQPGELHTDDVQADDVQTDVERPAGAVVSVDAPLAATVDEPGDALPTPLDDAVRPSAPDVLPGTAASPHAPSVGSHWSAGVHEDDPFTNTFSRQVGSATTSTNALVLPEMPRGDLAGPVPGTGEIIITGMIDVPQSVASTGAVPSIHDSPDIDDLFDVDTEYASTDSAPVSAISAVSSHTATRDVMGGKRARRSGVLTTVLVSATVVLAVVAVGLFVVAAVNGLF